MFTCVDSSLRDRTLVAAVILMTWACNNAVLLMIGGKTVGRYVTSSANGIEESHQFVPSLVVAQHLPRNLPNRPILRILKLVKETADKRMVQQPRPTIFKLTNVLR